LAINYKVIIVPGINWDRSWDNTFQQYRIKLVKCIDRLIQVLNNDHRNTKFTFSGQTAFLEDYLEIRPEMEKELKRLIQNGNIIVGPWYTLSDEFLVSPESLVRNLMLGHIIAESSGNVMKVGYVPDSSGQISQLPQILQGFGIDSVIFTRGPGDEDENPGHEFLWYSSDEKTSVLAIHQMHDYNDDNINADNADVKLQNLIDSTKNYIKTPNVLFINNICNLADIVSSGNGKTESELGFVDTVDYVNEKLNGAELINGSFTDYINLVKAEEIEFGKYQGELRGSRFNSVLSGITSSRIYMKQANEASQTLIEKWAEPFSAISWLETGIAYPKAFLWYAWKELLKNHSQNNISGCSIDEVHREDMIRYGWVQQIGNELTSNALNVLTRKINFTDYPLVVFNPLAWERSDPVTVDIDSSIIPENPVVKNSESELVPSQILMMEDGTSQLTFQGRIPAFGYATYYLDSGTEKSFISQIKIGSRIMENQFYRIRINSNGTMDILDKLTGIDYKECGLFEDREDCGDECDYSSIKNGKTKTITNKAARANIRIIENGPIKATVEIKFSINLPKRLTKDRESRTAEKLSCAFVTKVTIYSNIPRIDFSTTFENKIEDHRLRVVFPTNIKTDFVTVEGHFDVLKRPLNHSKPKTKLGLLPAMTNHQGIFLDVDDGEKGFTLINKGLPEYEVHKGKNGCTIYLTLLRCVGWMSRDDIDSRQNHVGKSQKATPEAQCPGTHTFDYSIIPHKGDWSSAGIHRRAYEHNVPVWVVHGVNQNQRDENTESLPRTQSFISVEPSNLMVTALKKAELGDGLILRFYNATDKTVEGVIRTYKAVKSARLVNLDESPVPDGELSISDDGSIRMQVEKHEIKTVELGFV
jgi:mannosylglycerate hydrolase